MNILPHDNQVQALTGGCSIRSVERLADVSEEISGGAKNAPAKRLNLAEGNMRILYPNAERRKNRKAVRLGVATGAGIMGIYDPLRDHLRSLKLREFEMSFSEIKEITGRPLPASAELPQCGPIRETARVRSEMRGGMPDTKPF